MSPEERAEKACAILKQGSSLAIAPFIAAAIRQAEQEAIAREREECAKVAEKHVYTFKGIDGNWQSVIEANPAAAAIRARG